MVVNVGGTTDASDDGELSPEEALVPTAMDRVTATKPRNVLLVTVVRARDLPIADKALLLGKGSSDPFVSLKISRHSSSSETTAACKTTVKKRTLNPVYKESFRLAAPESHVTLRLRVDVEGQDSGD